MLHKCFYILLNRVSVLRSGKRLEVTLTLAFLHLLDLFCVNVELLEELKGSVGVTVRGLKVVKQMLECGSLSLFLTSSACSVLVLLEHRDVRRCSSIRRLLRYCALNVHLLLVVVHFQVLRESTDDFCVDLRLELEWVSLEIEHTKRLEFLQHLDEVYDPFICELDTIVLERHFHDVTLVFLTVS